MSKILMLILLMLIARPGSAQRVREWIRQKKTQKQYLIEQIAELKIYLTLTQKGYQIAKEGLDLMGAIKKGEFSLHKNYLDSLLIVNPRITSYSRLVHITVLHRQINQVCTQLPASLDPALGAENKKYITQVLGLLYEDCQAILSSLLTVIRDGNLSMGDKERISRIEHYFTQMQSNYDFARSFQQQTMLLGRQIQNEASEIQSSRALQGLN